MPSIKMVLESALYVSDLSRAVAFYRDVLGLPLLDEFDEMRGVAFAVGPSVLLLFRPELTLNGGSLPSHGARGPGHVAFSVRPEDMPAWRDRLLERGVAIECEHAFGENPASIFFRDPDGNLLEFAVASIWSWSVQ